MVIDASLGSGPRGLLQMLCCLWVTRMGVHLGADEREW